MSIKDFFSKFKSFFILLFTSVIAIITGVLLGKSKAKSDVEKKQLEEKKKNEKTKLENMSGDDIINNADNKSDILQRKDEVRKEADKRLRESIKQYIDNHPIQ